MLAGSLPSSGAFPMLTAAGLPATAFFHATARRTLLAG